MVAKIDVELAPEPEVVTTARHTLDRLANLLPSEKLEDVRLVVSELVTNSIRHAGLSPDDQSRLRWRSQTERCAGACVTRAPASGYLWSLTRGLT